MLKRIWMALVFLAVSFLCLAILAFIVAAIGECANKEVKRDIYIIFSPPLSLGEPG